MALRAEDQGEAVDTGDGLLDRYGVVGERERHGGEAALAEGRERVVPVGQAGPRQREDRTHGDLHGAAVERVRAAGREEHGVEAEGGAGAEDRADVGVVDDLLEDQHGAGAVEDLVEGGQRAPLERGEGAAVHVEAGDLLGERLGEDVAGGVRGVEDVGQAGRASAAPSGRTARREAGLDRAAYDLLALGEEQAVLGLEVLAQLDVAQVAVVGQPRVVAGRPTSTSSATGVPRARRRPRRPR